MKILAVYGRDETFVELADDFVGEDVPLLFRLVNGLGDPFFFVEMLHEVDEQSGRTGKILGNAVEDLKKIDLFGEKFEKHDGWN